MRSNEAKLRLLAGTSFPERMVRFLSAPRITVAILVVSILARIIQLVFFFNIQVDASYQVMATAHFVNGNGISLASVNPNDLSEVVYEPLINWPPGYSLLLAPFYLLFGGNYILAGITLDIIMALVLMASCRAILKQLGCPVALQNLCTLVNGFFIYPFYFIASSDAIAISFFSVLLYVLIRLLQKKGKDPIGLMALICISFIIATIKYLFVPVVFTIPFYLAVAGHLNKEKDIRKCGLISFGALLLLVGAFLLYQVHISGQAGYISSQERGFYPGHLLDTYPFIIGSFLKADTVTLLTNQLLGEKQVHQLFQIATLVLTIYISYFFFQKLREKRYGLLSAVHAFCTVSFFLSVSVFLVLAVLSVKVGKEEILPSFFWTYVQDHRYYGLVILLFHLSFFVFFRHFLRYVSNITRYCFYLLSFFLLLELGRGVYLTSQRIKNFGQEEYSWQYEDRFQKSVGAVIDKAKQVYPGTQIIVSGSSYYYNHRFSLFSHVPVLYDYTVILNQDKPRSKKPVVLVSVILKSYEPFIKQKDQIGKWQGEFESFSIYTRYVAAN